MTPNCDRLRILADGLECIPDEKLSLCGWAACAIGHGCRMPKLMGQGLEMGGYMPTFKDGNVVHVNWDAVMKFFGINRDTAFYLFDMDAYEKINSVADVVSRIREFIKEHGPCPTA